MWNYSVVIYNAQAYGRKRLSAFRLCGHTPRYLPIVADDVCFSLTTQRYTLNGSDPSIGPAGTTVYIPPSQRVLLADATLSSPAQRNPAQAATYQWTLDADAAGGISTMEHYTLWAVEGFLYSAHGHINAFGRKRGDAGWPRPVAALHQHASAHVEQPGERSVLVVTGLGKSSGQFATTR